MGLVVFLVLVYFRVYNVAQLLVISYDSSLMITKKGILHCCHMLGCKQIVKLFPLMGYNMMSHAHPRKLDYPD